VLNSRKADTMRYEFVAIHPKTDERALSPRLKREILS